MCGILCSPLQPQKHDVLETMNDCSYLHEHELKTPLAQVLGRWTLPGGSPQRHSAMAWMYQLMLCHGRLQAMPAGQFLIDSERCCW